MPAMQINPPGSVCYRFDFINADKSRLWSGTTLRKDLQLLGTPESCFCNCLEIYEMDMVNITEERSYSNSNITSWYCIFFNHFACTSFQLHLYCTTLFLKHAHIFARKLDLLFLCFLDFSLNDKVFLNSLKPKFNKILVFVFYNVGQCLTLCRWVLINGCTDLINTKKSFCDA